MAMFQLQRKHVEEKLQSVDFPEISAVERCAGVGGVGHVHAEMEFVRRALYLKGRAEIVFSQRDFFTLSYDRAFLFPDLETLKCGSPENAQFWFCVSFSWNEGNDKDDFPFCRNPERNDGAGRIPLLTLFY